MGSCCFTPSKRDFLWWYWLLLASIVGIPMLLAVLYVRRNPGAEGESEEEKRKRGRIAARIFWCGSLFVAIGTFLLANVILTLIWPDEHGKSVFAWVGYWSWEGYQYSLGYRVLAIQFFLAFVMANFANDAVRRKRWYARLPLLLCFVLLHLVVVFCAAVPFSRPAINVMQFMACMLPAHYWGRFKDSPTQRTAWTALAGFVAGAGLFFVVSYYGEDFAQLLLGPPPGGFKG